MEVALDQSAKQVAIDTEGVAKAPFCLSFSTKPGTGWVVKATDTEELARFALWLKTVKPLCLIHNSLWDLPVLRAMGIDILSMGLKVIDTMVAAFLLQVEPLGLKALALRHCGMSMQTFEQVVGSHLEAAQWGIVHSAHASLKLELGAQVAKEALSLSKPPKPLKPGKDWSDSAVLRALAKTHEHSGAWKRVNSAVKDLSKHKPVNIADRFSKWPEEVRKVVLVAAESQAWPALGTALQLVPQSEWLPYACRDADATLRLWPHLAARLRAMDLEFTLDLDMSRLAMVDGICSNPLLVNLDKVQALKQELQLDVDAATAAIQAYAVEQGMPEDFNPGSGDQISELFFDRLGIGQGKRLKKTKGGKRLSTDDTALEMCKGQHPVVDYLLEYRAKDKLLSSYVLPMEEKTKPLPLQCGYGHMLPELSIARVVSARLAGWLLTWPTRSAFGKRIRDCIEAESGWEFGSWDLSQIEYRVFAHESQDPVLIEAYMSGSDMHSATMKAFNLPRDPSKTINFLILYGGSAKKLQEELLKAGLNFSLKQCEGIIADWHLKFPRGSQYMREVYAETQRDGFVRDMWGRIRYLPGIRLQYSGYPWSSLREAAKREAVNFKIQAGAQGIMERIMCRVWYEVLPRLLAEGIPCFIVFQIHDELVLKFQTQHRARVNELMLQAMKADSELFSVPIESKSSFATTWGALK